MENDFIYWRHPTPPGIKVEEICGGDDRAGVWRDMAMQIYCENGKDGYREVGHFSSGAPFLYSDQSRISITHTKGLLAVATLPRTPEAEMGVFSERTALGIDAERLDRSQVLKLRERFLSPDELQMTDAEDITANIMAWTIKEALYKAALTPGLDFRSAIRIISMPQLHENPVDPKAPIPVYGKGEIIFPDGTKAEMNLYSYESEGCCVTLAFSPKSATWKKHKNPN